MSWSQIINSINFDIRQSKNYTINAYWSYMKDVIVKSEFSIRLLNDGSFLDVYAMPKDNTPFDMRDIIKKRNSKKD